MLSRALVQQPSRASFHPAMWSALSAPCSSAKPWSMTTLTSKCNSGVYCRQLMQVSDTLCRTSPHQRVELSRSQYSRSCNVLFKVSAAETGQ
jgi:hypothetical protein